MAQSPLELARAVKQELALLRQEFDYLKKESEVVDLRAIQTQLAVLVALVEQSGALKLIERIAVLEAHVAENKRQKEEAEKRGWQWVNIGIGGILALVSGALMQLLAYALRK